ncbi:MAG: 2-oxo-4-hydroxy-4-carboxy-5-ureidoimidazoline decarboxylase [Deinococcales bacterium]
MYTLEEVNAFSEQRFEVVFKNILENCPHYALKAAKARPFRDLAAMHAAFMAGVAADPLEQQLVLVRAHPDLAGKAAMAGELTEESSNEQKGAGLDRLSPLEYADFMRINAAYRAKFAIPYIVCVRENTKESILAAAPIRLAHDFETELSIALGEIAKIAKYRLLDLVKE